MTKHEITPIYSPGIHLRSLVGSSSTIIPDVLIWTGGLAGAHRMFGHKCKDNTEDGLYTIGRIVDKEGTAYCENCEKGLNISYKTVIFTVKLACFRK